MVIVLSPETQAKAERIPDFAHRGVFYSTIKDFFCSQTLTNLFG